MQTINNILEELNELSPLLANFKKVNVYTVPDGYFEQFPFVALLGVNNHQESSFNHTHLEQVNNDVPAGYFENLSSSILGKIKDVENAEFDKISPLLQGLQYKNVYTVPNGYFEALPHQITNDLVKQSAKVISMPKRTASILKYAVAAVFVGVMVLGAFKFTQQKTTTILPEYVKNGLQINNVDEELAKLSDNAIVFYLQANGTDVDAALAASDVYSSDIIFEDEKLTDEKALDNLFENIDKEQLNN